MKAFGTCVFALVAGLAAPLGAETVWRCDFAEIARSKALISGAIEIRYTSGAETARLRSPLTDAVLGEPAKAQLMKETAKQVLVGWDVKIKNDANQHTTMRYRLNIVQGGKTANLTARPLGYDNSFSNGGACRQGKG